METKTKIQSNQVNDRINEIIEDLRGTKLDLTKQPTQEDIVGTNKYQLGEI